MSIRIIAAVDEDRGLGKAGKIPWNSPADRAFFADLTNGFPVIMGRKTWESLPGRLAGRMNIVVSSQGPFRGAVIARTLSEAVTLARGDCFVIGGAELYAEALKDPRCEKVYLTRIAGRHGCDVFMPEIGWEITSQVEAANLLVDIYEPEKWPEESEFNRTLRSVLDAPVKSIIGAPVGPRTGIQTRSLFGKTVRFTLRDGDDRIMPLLTCKKIQFDSVYYELMWFLRGCKGDYGRPNVDYLNANGVHIWDANTTREALNARGLVGYLPGETGPIYGSQWREWQPSPKTNDWEREAPDAGYDQLRNAIRLLREDPYSRQNVVSAWNVAYIPFMALPPCHFAFQFLVDSNGITCVATMRSGDMGLGVPFNIASYALLTHLVSRVVGIPAYQVIINVSDCHIYANHEEGVRTWLLRRPRSPPRLRFSAAVTGDVSIDDFHQRFTREDIIIEGYFPHGCIKLDMAV